MLAILDEYKHHLDSMSCDHFRNSCNLPMNRKKYWHLSQGHSYIYFLFSLLKPQEKKKKPSVEGQLKLSSFCQCRTRDICW